MRPDNGSISITMHNVPEGGPVLMHPDWAVTFSPVMRLPIARLPVTCVATMPLRVRDPRFYHTRFAQNRIEFLEKTEKRILKYGNFAILFGRLITAIRSIVPLLTGVSGMTRLRYSAYDLLACGIWTAGLGLLIVGIDKIWS